MALEKLSPSGAPILPRMLYGEESGGTEHIIIVDSSGKPLVVEASAAAILAKLDVNLSRAALGANVAQRIVTANYGFLYGFIDGGTAIPAMTTQTPLSISGFGKITNVHFEVEHPGNTVCIITLDGTVITGQLSLLSYLISYNNNIGHLQAGFARLGHNESGKYGADFECGRLGAFGTSALVTINNTRETVEKVNCRINYFTSASEKWSVNNPAVTDVAAVRKDLANTLGLDEEAITTIYQENWDEVLRQNVPSLSTIVHPHLSDAGKTEVVRFLDDRKALSTREER